MSYNINAGNLQIEENLRIEVSSQITTPTGFARIVNISMTEKFPLIEKENANLASRKKVGKQNEKYLKGCKLGNRTIYDTPKNQSQIANFGFFQHMLDYRTQ
ncbi:hypothetical protein [Bacillus cereus]|uniref:hypothetical protein n=1 Tax=Bacillus cereus TaxID=1396 RepID=UPI000953049B|nr:hypothetical protein [Bacillus cereus]OLR27681.1 hypothetical protein BLD50_00350 [Bacillus cereus]